MLTTGDSTGTEEGGPDIPGPPRTGRLRVCEIDAEAELGTEGNAVSVPEEGGVAEPEGGAGDTMLTGSLALEGTAETMLTGSLAFEGPAAFEGTAGIDRDTEEGRNTELDAGTVLARVLSDKGPAVNVVAGADRLAPLETAVMPGGV